MLNVKLRAIENSGLEKSGGGEPVRSEKAKILLLDDEERILNSLRAIFRFKYDVYATTSSEEALGFLRSHDIAVVISDQRMPAMTGIEFLRLAKTISPETVRILLTGFSDLQAVIDSVNDGEVFRFLNKPWGNKEIQAIMEEAVSIYGDIRQHGMPVPSSPTSAVMRNEKHKVLVKCGDKDLFEEIKKAALPSMEFVHAQNQQAALDVLQQSPVSVMVTLLDETAAKGEDEFDFLKLLKRELPGLLTISMVQSADYDDIISLINEAKVYRYVVLPTKSSKIIFFIESALQQVKLQQSNPVLLRQQSVEQSRPLKEAYEKTGSFMAKVGAIRKLFSRR